ncbi:hypothetical protein LR48_Vigan10g205600 [Vigna angularis]|uniref:Uncharacterized protein n=2 Tax=Phaseolus angularis TaxID=3914 RepID=A0A0L9VN40_PHAAN|nr:hypothetical protein LR48_Vigan10g205600 [Vigna angularis]BAU01615.1 hypothetical protein VIGAN_11088400 [Vigna angularis var. angularis]
MQRSEFEFPATDFSGAVADDVVFCGKVITRRTEPSPAPQSESKTRVLPRAESSGHTSGILTWLRSPSAKEKRWRRNESCRKRKTEMFGTVLKFPLQMELSDIKMRQDRRECLPPPPLPPRVPSKDDDDDGGESCWELVRPLRPGGTFKNLLFQCIPIL